MGCSPCATCQLLLCSLCSLVQLLPSKNHWVSLTLWAVQLGGRECILFPEAVVSLPSLVLLLGWLESQKPNGQQSLKGLCALSALQ